MSYTVTNFRTKKALREAVARYLTDREQHGSDHLEPEVRCFQPGLGHDLSNFTGTVYLEGPHYPEAHKWYAQGMMVGGVLMAVK